MWHDLVTSTVLFFAKPRLLSGFRILCPRRQQGFLHFFACRTGDLSQQGKARSMFVVVAAASRANFDFDSRGGIGLRLILHIGALCVKQQPECGCNIVFLHSVPQVII